LEAFREGDLLAPPGPPTVHIVSAAPVASTGPADGE